MKRFLELFIIIHLFAAPAVAGLWEVSLGFGYERSNYAIEESFSWTRVWRFSLGYHINNFSGVEISFSDSTDRTRILGLQDITTHDRIYGANWIQSILSRRLPVQPYIKLGLAQLNREAKGTYFGIPTSARVDSITGVIGIGTRIYLIQRVALRIEATSLLAGGRIGSWKDNIKFNAGGSLYF